MSDQTTGDWIRGARRAMGLTQTELAERLGVTQPIVARWETGRCEPLGRVVLAMLDLLAPPAPKEQR